MIYEIRLAWEPENKTPLNLMEERCKFYIEGKSGGVSLLENGTWLFTPNGRDNESDVKRAMLEAKFLIDFNVVEMKLGGYLVGFNHVVAVFVGEEEFKAMKNEIQKRKLDLMFPEEHLLGKEGAPEDHLLIGLYARGKLQRDAYTAKMYSRINESL